MTDLVYPDEPLRHGPIVLRQFRKDDLELVQELSRDPYSVSIGTFPPDADEKAARTWIRGQSPRLADIIGYSFCIADAETDEGLGQAVMWPTDLAEGRATVGYFVAPRARGRRAASHALAALTEFAWRDPRLHRLEAYVEPWNGVSVHGVERVGYQHEGLLRERQPIDGGYRDVLLYSRLRSDGPLPQF